jgi:voltage-gated potassium channel
MLDHMAEATTRGDGGQTGHQVDPEARRHRWEELTTWPLMVVAVLFLVAYAVLVIDTTLDPAVRRLCSSVLALAWWAFLADYVVRLVLAVDRLRFVRRHLTDLATVAVPALRPLLLLRAVTVLERSLEHNLGGRMFIYVAALTTLAVGTGSLAVLGAERGQPGANIEDFGTALWWATTTATTVGYGDHFPVTGQGRLIAAALMLCGIGLIGVVTASLASYIVDRVSAEEESIEQRTHHQVEALVREVTALRQEVARIRTDTGGGPETPGGFDSR